MAEHWDLVTGLKWHESTSGEERRYIAATSYPVGTRASTCEVGAGVCRILHVVSITGYQGVSHAWDDGHGGFTLALDAEDARYGVGSTVDIL